VPRFVVSCALVVFCLASVCDALAAGPVLTLVP